MKAVILASLFTLVDLLLVTVAFRLLGGRRRAFSMLVCFIVSSVFMVITFALTPRDLGILSPRLSPEPAWFDLMAALFFHTAAFFGGVLQLYNLADRGFSLRVIIDICGSPDGSMTIDREVATYSEGRGLRWMYDKRIDGMIRNGFALVEDDALILTDKGWRTAKLFGGLRRLLRVRTEDGKR